MSDGIHHEPQIERGDMNLHCARKLLCVSGFATDGPIKIGVSYCLLGAEVRFDSGHKRSDFLVDTLGRFIEFVPLCPELEIGLGIPREPKYLVKGSNTRRLLPPR
jgi:2-thiouracil desulfurase